VPNLGCVARRPRDLYQGIYHLAARASDTRHLFVNDQDREDFLERLAATWERFELALLSYVLMGSHYHALVRIPDGSRTRSSGSTASTRAGTTVATDAAPTSSVPTR
jgi:REP element-mobilizing transposase RayT